MTINMFRAEGFHMHGIEFTDEYVSIKYTHQGDSTDDVAVSKEVFINIDCEDQQLNYWLGELSQAVEELVAHSQRHLKAHGL
jgi:hypothetical protein